MMNDLIIMILLFLRCYKLILSNLSQLEEQSFLIS